MRLRVLTNLIFVVSIVVLSAVKLPAQSGQAQVVPAGPAPYTAAANSDAGATGRPADVHAAVFGLPYARHSDGQTSWSCSDQRTHCGK